MKPTILTPSHRPKNVPTHNYNINEIEDYRDRRTLILTKKFAYHACTYHRLAFIFHAFNFEQFDCDHIRTFEACNIGLGTGRMNIWIVVTHPP